MEMFAFDAIVFPSDGRPPHLVALMTSPMSGPDPHAFNAHEPRMPHPEVHMDYVAEGLGSRAWQYHVRTIKLHYAVKFMLTNNTACRGA